MTNTNIYTRLNNLVCALRADEDNCDLVGTVRDTVDSCRNYVGMVDRMEANIRTARESYYSFAKKVAEAAELGEFQEW